jgi:hypothetical protein
MRLRNMLFLLTLVLAVLPVMKAQEITGQIRGTVTDATGAVVPNASVTVTNTDRNQVIRTLHTGPEGEYVAPLLPVGTYSVEVSASGFRVVVHKDIVLNVSDRLTIDASLLPGAGSETVLVQETPIQVNTDTASVEGLIEGTQVRELPLNNRNYEQLVTLQPGVTSNAADQIYVGTTNPSGQVNVVSFSVNGQRNSQNNWTIDGADNLDHGSNITLLVYPSVDAISEFKVARSSYSPEFGRSSAGQINVVTRSGGSAFHGSLYEFFRNDALNANTPYNKHVDLPRKALRYNDFGGTIGGPVYIPGLYNEKKDKTFFFFSEEARRVTTPVTQTSDFPTDPMLAGNFPTTVCTAIDANGVCTASGTSISTFNPIAAAYIKDIYNKIPAMPGVVRSGSSISAVMPGVFNYREELYRLDHVLTSKIALMGRFINDSIPTQEPFGLFGPQANMPGVGDTKTNSPGQQWMGRATFQLSEKLYNEFGYAYSYGAIVSDPTGLDARSKSPDVASAVSLPYAVTLDRIPSVVFDDFNGGTIGSFGQYRDYNRNHNLFDNFSWTQGHHAMKFGMSFNHYQKVENAAGNNAGTYEFDATCNPSSSTDPICDGIGGFEQDWANFLLGYANSSFSQSSVDFNADIRQNLWEFYGQDQWRVRPNLTVSYGVRYSYFQTPWAAGNNLISFDPSQYSATNAPQLTAKGMIVPGTGNGTNGYIVGGVNSPYGKFITKQNKLDFAPRLGIVWDPTGKGKTSVRAGYGLFYDSIAAGLIEDNIFNNAGDANLGALISSPDVAGAGSTPMSIYGTDPNWKSPYTESWNVDIQREFGKGWIVDVGYVGSNSKHLPGVIDINQVQPGVAQAAGLVTASNPNVCKIIPPATTSSCPVGLYKATTASGEALNAYRPYVGFMQIGEISPIFKANYNALQTSVKKQFGANTTFGAFYTWGKSLTNNQTDRSSGTMYTYCIQCEYGRSTLDRRHVLTANAVYDTPWFKNQNGFAGHVFGGWEASSILTVNSGLPLTVLGAAAAAGDPTASGYYAPGPVGYGRVASIRPNQISDPNANAPHTWTNWFNTAAFAYQTVNGEAPTEHRGAVNGPGLWRVDLAMLKNVRIVEKLNMQFRIESFNLFNHDNPTTIGTTMGKSNFGQITGTRDGRTLQLGAKILF